MRPGEEFSVVTETDPEESSFNVVIHDQGVAVWVNSATDAESSTRAATQRHAVTSGLPKLAREQTPAVRTEAR